MEVKTDTLKMVFFGDLRTKYLLVKARLNWLAIYRAESEYYTKYEALMLKLAEIVARRKKTRKDSFELYF